ncbi:periphilin-1-like [Lampris incognitus]|uniref:periphilin-1-like n=1 Tax=Lampris incognitus TaxID=2546036 RepID=UPI0024B61593|nr:periphilin-1-like [Lampris incognitus]
MDRPRQSKDMKMPLRRVGSPTRPRAWMTGWHKPKSAKHVHRSMNEQSFQKPDFDFGYQRHRHFTPRSHSSWGGHYQPKIQEDPPHRVMAKNQVRKEEREKDIGEQSQPRGAISPPQEDDRPFLTSREKDKHFSVSHERARTRSREREHEEAQSGVGEQGGKPEHPSAAGWAAARNRAIQQKRREIEEVYCKDCDTFGVVVKMLIAKDPSLELPIQSSLQQNLREIGQRCVEALKQFIEEYDSRELSE